MLTIEHTDTFGGEANYSWVNRYWFRVDDAAPVDCGSRASVRIAKAACGYTGRRCVVEHLSDWVAIRPCGCACVIFIGYADLTQENKEYWRAEIDRNANVLHDKWNPE
jgi:hypothetical protein